MFIIIHHSTTLEFIRRFAKQQPKENEDFPSFWQLFNDSRMIIKKLPNDKTTGRVSRTAALRKCLRKTLASVSLSTSIKNWTARQSRGKSLRAPSGKAQIFPHTAKPFSHCDRDDLCILLVGSLCRWVEFCCLRDYKTQKLVSSLKNCFLLPPLFLWM